MIITIISNASTGNLRGTTDSFKRTLVAFSVRGKREEGISHRLSTGRAVLFNKGSPEAMSIHSVTRPAAALLTHS